MSDAGRERLKRIAYGRDATAEERSSAEESLRQLAEQDLALTFATTVEPSEVPSVEPEQRNEVDTVESVSDQVPHTVKSDSVEQGAGQPLWRRRIRIGWIAPIALGAFLLGLWAALGTDGQREPVAATASPTTPTVDGELGEVIAGGRSTEYRFPAPGTSARPAPEARPGNVDVADALFDQSATARDSYPIKGMLDQLGVDQSDVRLLLDDDNGHMLWAVKQGTAGFCLASYDVWAAMGHSVCATIEEFEASGVSIVTPGFSAWWGGAGLEMWGSR